MSTRVLILKVPCGTLYVQKSCTRIRIYYDYFVVTKKFLRNFGCVEEQCRAYGIMSTRIIKYSAVCYVIEYCYLPARLMYVGLAFF